MRNGTSITRIAAALAGALLLTGCISYTSSPQPVVPVVPACLYAGQPYSPGAKIYPPNSPVLQCRSDGSWAPL